VSSWTYVAIAYTVVWGALAVYALLLARRVAQAKEVERRLEDTDSGAGKRASASRPYTRRPYDADRSGTAGDDRGRHAEGDGGQKEQDGAACDAPPAP
jgi:hypothetical protein